VRIAAALLVCAGCASHGGTARHEVPAADIARLEPGAATTRDTSALLGEPFEVTRFERQKRTAWGYRVREEGQSWRYWLEFSDDGVLRDVIRSDENEMHFETLSPGLH